MIVHNLDSVRSALQRIPMEAADKHSAVEAGRALFTMHPSERSAVVDLLPESPTELWELGSEAGAKDALSIACVQSIMLRMAASTGSQQKPPGACLTSVAVRWRTTRKPSARNSLSCDFNGRSIFN
ncbi:hypothetical protein GCM10020255_049390 [Rhodococcus baikonurensis]